MLVLTANIKRDLLAPYSINLHVALKKKKKSHFSSDPLINYHMHVSRFVLLTITFFFGTLVSIPVSRLIGD